MSDRKRDLAQDGLGESAVFHPSVVLNYKEIGYMMIDGVRYDIAIDLKHANPIIISEVTGNRFVLSWEAIIEAAKRSGIDSAAIAVVGHV